MEKPRCLHLFEESCRSEATKKTYRKMLDYFLRWANKDYESVLLLPDDQLQILLEDYMLYCKRRYRKGGIKSRFAAIDKFFFINDRQLNKKKLFAFLPDDEKPGGQRAITTKELQDMILCAGNKRIRALIHLLGCTGGRPEAVANIRLKDMGQMPGNYLSLVLYADSTHEMITFAHPEATTAINEYLEERKEKGELLSQNSFLIRKASFIITENNPKPISVNSLESSINHVMKQAGIKRNLVGSRYDLSVCYGIRKRFNTILKSNPSIPFAIGELFMDHKVRMETSYLKPTKDELFEHYKKAVPELTIDDSERLKFQNERQSKKISELEEKTARIDEIERRLRMMEKSNDVNSISRMTELEKRIRMLEKS